MMSLYRVSTKIGCSVNITFSFDIKYNHTCAIHWNFKFKVIRFKWVNSSLGNFNNPQCSTSYRI